VHTVITGISSLRNRGVDALVTTSIEQLRQRLPSPSFLVLDQAPDYDACHLDQSDTRVRFDETLRPFYVSRIRSARMRASRFATRLAPEFQAVRQEIRAADLVCASGGDVFCSEYGRLSLLAHLAPLRIAREFGRPYFLLAQSIGPFATAADREAFRAVARDATGISVRERISYDYLTQDLDLPESLVTHTADPGFLLRCPQPDRLANLRRYYGCDGTGPLIAITPSQAICHWMQADHRRHLEAWCAVVTMLLRELGAHIILVPHVQEIAPWNDDRILITEIVRHFEFDPRLRVVGADHSASELKGIISHCDMVVAERMHSCIAALSSGICAVAIKYSIKAEGIFRDLFTPEQLADGLLLTLDDFLDANAACAKIRTAWQMRPAVEARLKERLPDVERRAGLTFDLVAERMRVST
jgi:colanic acid/amylovoran biosynthesis protein